MQLKNAERYRGTRAPLGLETWRRRSNMRPDETASKPYCSLMPGSEPLLLERMRAAAVYRCRRFRKTTKFGPLVYAVAVVSLADPQRVAASNQLSSHLVLLCGVLSRKQAVLVRFHCALRSCATRGIHQPAQRDGSNHDRDTA
jgi:hypothetical protein